MCPLLNVQVSCLDDAEGVRAASSALAAKDALWRRGQVLVQMGNAAALMHDGVLKHIWSGKVRGCNVRRCCNRLPKFAPHEPRQEWNVHPNACYLWDM
jgi:hypothetical protein